MERSKKAATQRCNQLLFLEFSIAFVRMCHEKWLIKMNTDLFSYCYTLLIRPLLLGLAVSVNKIRVHTLFRNILIENIPFDRSKINKTECVQNIHSLLCLLSSAYYLTFHYICRFSSLLFFNSEFQSIRWIIIFSNVFVSSLQFNPSSQYYIFHNFLLFYLRTPHARESDAMTIQFFFVIPNGFMSNDRWMIDTIHFIIDS